MKRHFVVLLVAVFALTANQASAIGPHSGIRGAMTSQSAKFIVRASSHNEDAAKEFMELSIDTLRRIQTGVERTNKRVIQTRGLVAIAVALNILVLAFLVWRIGFRGPVRIRGTAASYNETIAAADEPNESTAEGNKADPVEDTPRDLAHASAGKAEAIAEDSSEALPNEDEAEDSAAPRSAKSPFSPSRLIATQLVIIGVVLIIFLLAMVVL